MKTKQLGVTHKSNFNLDVQRVRPLARWSLIATLLWLLLPGAGLAQACTPRPTNMVAWWPGDGHAYDMLNGLEAILDNGVNFAPGKVGQAFSFDGAYQRVLISESRTPI